MFVLSINTTIGIYIVMIIWCNIYKEKYHSFAFIWTCMHQLHQKSRQMSYRTRPTSTRILQLCQKIFCCKFLENAAYLCLRVNWINESIFSLHVSFKLFRRPTLWNWAIENLPFSITRVWIHKHHNRHWKLVFSACFKQHILINLQ